MNLIEDKASLIDLIRTTINDLRDLPTLPSMAIEVRKIASDPKSNMANLVEVIEEDMALTSRILRIANSAYYGVPRKIDNLKMALVILGMNEISNMVMTITILRLFSRDDQGRAFDIKSFWRHSAACAELTVGLYQGLAKSVPSSAYIAGLLHDIGKLIMDQHFHEYFMACLGRAEEEQVSMADAELHVIGVDHGHVGSWLTKRWNIPEDICQAVAQHHIRPADYSPHGLAAVIDRANRISHLFENQSVEETIEILTNDQEWNDWFVKGNVGTPQLITQLDERLQKSITMVDILD